MANNELDQLRQRVEELNLQLLSLINERARTVQEIGRVKETQGVNRYDPVRERHMLDLIKDNNNGPFENSTILHLFKQIFKAGLELQEDDHRKELLVSRKKKAEDTVINLKGELIGTGNPHFVFGPCSVESYEQVAAVAASVKAKGLKLLRGGAYKPRTSPYDFQGLGVEGLKILKRVADEYDLAVISEIVTPADIDTALQYIDVIQIGARNMQNFELLKAAGSVNKPVLLKRGMSATIEEFINAAEYIMSQGNGQIIFVNVGFEHMKEQQEIHLIFQLFQFLNKKHIYQYLLMLRTQQEEKIYYFHVPKRHLLLELTA